MPKTIKLNSLLVLVLAIAFFIFFDQTKHLPLLADILPFGEDPYDAVGSFGIQLAFFAALLAMLRAFRPYEGEPGQNQVGLLLRTQGVSVLAVAVTLAADLVAMLRYRSAWLDAASLLISLMAGMILVTALVAWRILGSIKSIVELKPVRSWLWVWIVVPASLLILAFYPEGWREGIIGGIFTAMAGMTLLFLQVWALAAGQISAPADPYEDALDDLAAVYRWLKSRSGSMTSRKCWPIRRFRSWAIWWRRSAWSDKQHTPSRKACRPLIPSWRRHCCRNYWSPYTGSSPQSAAPHCECRLKQWTEILPSRCRHRCRKPGSVPTDQTAGRRCRSWPGIPMPP